MRPLFRSLLSLLSLLIFCQIVSGPSLHAAQLSGWIEPSPASVNLTAEGSRDWIQGGYNGDYTKLNRKVGANVLSGLTVANPNNNGAFVRGLGPTISWSDGTPDATCSGTTNGVHAGSISNTISFTVPAGVSPRTIRIYSSSVHAAMQFKAHLSDGSAPDWVNDDWYASNSGTITPKATLSFASASGDAILTVTITNVSGSDWPSVGIHAVTLQDGATAAPPTPLPPLPTGLIATASNGQVMVQWNQGPFASSYNVYRSTNGSIPSSPWRSGILPMSGNNDSSNLMLSTLDTAASNGTTFYYWIAAVNAGGEARAPQAVTATPAAPTSTAITTGRMLKIMPIGDSITYGYPVVGGYRKQLLQDLSNGGYQVHMVGRAGYNSTSMAEPLHEGWPGKTVEYLRDSVVDFSLPAYQPDLILLMIGTNNLAWGGKTQTDVDNALSAYDGLLAKINTLAPNATVIVSPILPIQGTDLPTVYNQALHNRVNALASQGRQIYWCGQMSNITLAQLDDGVHPGAGAYSQMGDAWYAAIQSVTSGSSGNVASPNFTPAAGSYSSAQAVTMASNTAGATIYFTTDGSNPTTSSTTYTGALSVSSSSTIKAMAVASGKTNSPVVSATYTIVVPPTVVAAPTFSPAPGTYSSTQSVTIASTTSGATIRYTTDGSTPNGASAVYTGAISVSSTTTIRAIATASGMSDSPVNGGTYTISIVVPPETVATPTFTPAPGTYSSAQSVTIASNTSGATVRYTTDGSTPNGSSTIYTGAVSVNSTTTIRAIATASGMTDSQVAVGTYTIAAPPGGTGSGLTGTYFTGSNFSGTSVTRGDGTVDFDWGQGSPFSGISVDNFSVRWTGQVQAQFSEIYTFTTLSDDGVRLWVGGQLLV